MEVLCEMYTRLQKRAKKSHILLLGIRGIPQILVQVIFRPARTDISKGKVPNTAHFLPPGCAAGDKPSRLRCPGDLLAGWLLPNPRVHSSHQCPGQGWGLSVGQTQPLFSGITPSNLSETFHPSSIHTWTVNPLLFFQLMEVSLLERSSALMK